jgi:hypothetical protein
MELILLLVALIILQIVLFASVLVIAGAAFAYGALVYTNGAERDGRWSSSFVRQTLPIWRWLRRLYRFRVVDHSEVPIIGPVLYAHHPHGMLATSATLFYADKLNVRLAVHSNFFRIPLLLREPLLWFGAIEADPLTIGVRLLRGNSVALLPGGVREQAVAKPDAESPVGATEPIRTNFLFWSFHAWHKPVVPVWAPAEFDVCWVWKPAALTGLRAWGMRQRWLRYPLGTLPSPPAYLFSHLGRDLLLPETLVDGPAPRGARGRASGPTGLRVIRHIRARV